MKYVTIDKWILDNDEITHAQLVTCDKYSFKIKSEIVDAEDLLHYYENKNDEDIFGYTIENNMILSDPNTVVASLPDGMEIEKSTHYLEPINNSIYSLFTSLIDDNAYFVVSEGLNHIDSIENYITEFVPKYSASTMSVYISLQVNQYWKSVKLIYAENDAMKYNDFYFRIPKQVRTKYKYEEVGSFKLGNNEYIIMHYQGENPLYVYDPSRVVIYNSLINRRVFLSKQLKNYINAVSFMRRMFCKELMKVEYRTSSTSKMKVFEGNVKFESTAEDVSKEELTNMLEDIILNYVKFLMNNPKPEEITEFITSRTKNGIAANVYHILAKIFLNTNGTKDVGALFNLCTDMMLEYEKQKSKIDALIYAYRINYFTFETPYMIDGETFVGGNIPASTRFKHSIRRG